MPIRACAIKLSALCCALWHSDIAVALHTPPHRVVSLALVAQALGATQGKGRLIRSMKNLSTGSFVLPKGRISSRKSVLAAEVSKAVDVKVCKLTSTEEDI